MEGESFQNDLGRLDAGLITNTESLMTVIELILVFLSRLWLFLRVQRHPRLVDEQLRKSSKCNTARCIQRSVNWIQPHQRQSSQCMATKTFIHGCPS